MIGALAIKNRRKKQQLAAGKGDIALQPVEIQDNFRTKCHFLYISAGVCSLIAIIILIPAFFGNGMFYVYSASFFGAGLLLFVLACFLHSDTRNTATNTSAPANGSKLESNAQSTVEFDCNSGSPMVEVVVSPTNTTPSPRPSVNGATVEHAITTEFAATEKLPVVTAS